MRRRDALRAGATLLGTGLLGGRAAAHELEPPSGDTGAAATATPRDTAATDATDGGAYSPLGRLDIEGTKEAVLGSDGQVAYLALTDGYGIVDVSDPRNPAVLAERRGLRAGSEDGAIVQVYDVKQSGDTLAVVGPANGIHRGSRGALLVDVSDPASPQERAFYPTEYPIHNCFLDGSTLYLTGNGLTGNPLVVVDVGGEEPTELARWALTDHEEAWSDVPPNLRPLHDVWVRDGLAVLAYWEAGTYLLDVSDPAEPTHVGTIPAVDPDALSDPPPRAGVTLPGNHHYAATDPANDLLAVGAEAWGTLVDDEYQGGPGGVDLYDVSDPASPTRLSTIAPPPTPDPTLTGVWTTSHNLQLRDGTLYTSWYQGGVKRHDVSDPANPVERTWWADPSVARFWTARVAADGWFLASSMGTDDAPAGLWTFPDEAGVGGDRAALREQAESIETSAPTSTGSATSRTTADTSTGTSTSAATEATGPGFGAPAALGGAGLTAWWTLAGRRRR